MIEIIKAIDVAVNQNIVALHTPFLTIVMKFISLLFELYTVIAVSLLLVGLFIYRKQTCQAFLLIFATLGGGVLIYIFKELLQRARPLSVLIVESGYSLPSGHTAIATILVLLLLHIFKEKIKQYYLLYWTIGGLIVVLVAFSRIYLQAHWLSDVLAGFVLGVLWFLIYVLMTKIAVKNYLKIKENKKNKK